MFSPVSTDCFLPDDLLVYLFIFLKKIILFPSLGTMLFSGRRRKVNVSPESELYGHTVQFYAQPPLENISLNDFEAFAVERLKCEAPDLFCLSEILKH